MPADATPKALHRALLQRQGALLVTRDAQAAVAPAPGQPGIASGYTPSEPEVFLAVLDDGQVLGFSGKVDLGTGIRTALTQIVAEELDVAPARVSMVMGHTEASPNQGPTIASATIQVSAVPLRNAAAQARAQLLALAAAHFEVDPDGLTVEDGQVRAADGRTVGYARLVQDRHLRLRLLPQAGQVPLKPPGQYRLVGRDLPRVDLQAKATGGLVFVHEVRVPGMLHGRVVRPPYAGRDGGDFVGTSLVSADAGSVSSLPGFVRLVVDGDFVGVVCEREEQAIHAAGRLVLHWRAPPPAPALDDLEAALRRQPSVERPLVAQGDAAAALAASQRSLARTYVWPYQMHASIGPSCAVADWSEAGLTVWSGSQNPHMLRIDLDRLLKIGEDRIEVVRLEAAGCYGRNCADDVCADAALLSRAVGRPVRVQLSREQEHAWEPKGAAQLMDVWGALDGDGSLSACRFETRYPSNDAPMLALLLTGAIPPQPRTLEMGDRTAVPPYRYPNLAVSCHDMPPLVRASWLRGVSALPNSFAHEALVDELAELAGADPVEFRLRHLDDLRACELLAAVAEAAGWQRGVRGSRGTPGADGLLAGRGVAYARYVHSRFPGFGAAWAAWVVDLGVDPVSGRIRITRVVVGQDNGMVVNPQGVRQQIHGNVVQALSRTLMERVEFDGQGVVGREWGGYPIIDFTELPPIEVLLMPRPLEPPLGAGESACVPGPAAIANGLHDAIGVRLCRPPFTPDVVRSALEHRTRSAGAGPRA